MARIVCISSKSLHPAVNRIGDIVEVFGDDHVFDPNELTMFEVIDMPGVDAAQVAELLPRNDQNNATAPPGEKYKYSVLSLTKTERDTLKDGQVPAADRLAVLGRIKNKKTVSIGRAL